MEENKKIYFILTHTGTVLSKIIRLYTKKTYSHISIALDDSLNTMYSFGRLYAYNPLIGGFVIEGKMIGTFKRFKNTDALVLSYDVSEEQYERIKKDIDVFINNKKKYRFNMVGLIFVALNRKIKIENSFYCAEFVKYIVEKEDIITNLPNIIKPEDFRKVSNTKLVYQGKLAKYEKIAN